MTWACPEGLHEHARSGACEPIPGWNKSDKQTPELMSLSAGPFNDGQSQGDHGYDCDRR